MKSLKQQASEFPGLKWYWFSLEQMEPILLYDLLAMREAIFVVEQNCVYLELDGEDKIALHLLAIQDKKVVACLRVLPPIGQEARVRIGRVAVLAGWRKQGMARQMMQKAIDKVNTDYPSCNVFLNAQTYLQTFYQTLGFQVCGSEFLEDGIPHVAMQMQIP